MRAHHVAFGVRINELVLEHRLLEQAVTAKRAKGRGQPRGGRGSIMTGLGVRSVPVRVGLDTEAHRNATERNALHLDVSLQREAEGKQDVGELAHRHPRLGR